MPLQLVSETCDVIRTHTTWFVPIINSLSELIRTHTTWFVPIINSLSELDAGIL